MEVLSMNNDNFHFISIKNSDVDEDISMYIEHELDAPRCQRWPLSIRQEIKENLTSKSDGM